MVVPYLLWMQSICQRDVALGREYLIVPCVVGAVTDMFFQCVLDQWYAKYCIT